MASFAAFCILLLLGTLVPAITLAKEFIVGDEAGWRLGVDYQAWANGKDFRVGDKLVFRYPVGAHNVVQVDKSSFQNCVTPPASKVLSSGNDTIELKNLGSIWFLCGVGKHCENGMKLHIFVKPEEEHSRAAATNPKEFIVGDEAGWKLDVDYQAWAKGKNFRVGDKLAFKYAAGFHNVLPVNGAAYKNCIKSPAAKALTTGNDTIVLSTPGNKWYICGIGKHCEHGMKLALTVQ